MLGELPTINVKEAEEILAKDSEVRQPGFWRLHLLAAAVSGKLFSLSVPQFLHVEGGDGNSAYLLGLIGE